MLYFYNERLFSSNLDFYLKEKKNHTAASQVCYLVWSFYFYFTFLTWTGIPEYHDSLDNPFFFNIYLNRQQLYNKK